MLDKDQAGLNRESGRGRMGGTRPGAGPGGNCVCPQCNQTVPHERGKPCTETMCPNCGSSMMRQ